MYIKHAILSRMARSFFCEADRAASVYVSRKTKSKGALLETLADFRDYLNVHFKVTGQRHEALYLTSHQDPAYAYSFSVTAEFHCLNLDLLALLRAELVAFSLAAAYLFFLV